MTSTEIAAGSAGARHRADGVPRLVLAAAAILFAIGVLGYLAAASQLVWSDVFAGFLSYGRLLPASTSLLVYGWLALGALAAAWYVVPRLGGAAIDRRLGGPAAMLVLVGASAGAAAVALGAGTGGRYLEAPWWSEGAVAVGLLAGAVAVTRSARSSGDRLPVASWYLVAALWWAALALATGAVPGLSGIPAALQARFAGTVLVGLVPVAAGLGVAYFLVARLVPASSFHPRLGRIGFWSLGFAWLWMGPRDLLYGPTPDWLETIPVLFAAGLVVALITILADFAWALRGRWQVVGASPTLASTVAGLAAFSIVPVHMLVQSLRGASTVVHFTLWEPALEQLLLFGAASFWLLGLVSFVFGGARAGRLPAKVHLWASGAGLVVAAIASWVAGLQQGYTWVATAGSEEIANFGEGFRNSVTPLDAAVTLRLAGLALYAIGALAALAPLASRRRDSDEAIGEATAEGPGYPVRVVWRGAIALIVVAALAVFVLPAVDADEEPSPLAEASRLLPEGTLARQGRDIYVREGCWLCHTQQVRAIVTDVGLGRVSQPGDYAYDGADILGVTRIGPDLAHAGTREGTGSEMAVRDHLADPRASRPWSTMPAYGHLSDGDLDALAAYVASLE